MRRLYSTILALAVAVAAAGGDVLKLCACKCGQVEEFCPCGHSNDGSDLPMDPLAPAASACISHLPSNSPMTVGVNGLTEIHEGKNAKPAPDDGKSFNKYIFLPHPQTHSAALQPIAARAGPLCNPPRLAWLDSLGKTNTRLAALSIFRI
jgi:hypothetical protein